MIAFSTMNWIALIGVWIFLVIVIVAFFMGADERRRR